MDHATAKAIAFEIAPELIVDEPHGKLTSLFNVRKREGGMPFSIHLPALLPDPDRTPEEAVAQERQLLQHALESAVKSFA
jgi:hypothetical protein